jgi:hypothetical protein
MEVRIIGRKELGEGKVDEKPSRLTKTNQLRAWTN